MLSLFALPGAGADLVDLRSGLLEFAKLRDRLYHSRVLLVVVRYGVEQSRRESIPEVGNLTRKRRRREERSCVVRDTIIVEF